ncbi:UNKNOWN [Stylonychia lemnae]|uniref:C2HC/C3H-type domain-containing protein n=1 Tax=Stylonychia lemnae TaxID=5949 RepID=A0A077ZY47_STYLE|nr:UNKNOWN [Stylonychia lemnae]|eukprot:CDW74552.1 UNKNOWN [Stylonychia lemnae]
MNGTNQQNSSFASRIRQPTLVKKLGSSDQHEPFSNPETQTLDQINQGSKTPIINKTENKLQMIGAQKQTQPQTQSMQQIPQQRVSQQRPLTATTDIAPKMSASIQAKINGSANKTSNTIGGKGLNTSMQQQQQPQNSHNAGQSKLNQSNLGRGDQGNNPFQRGTAVSNQHSLQQLTALQQQLASTSSSNYQSRQSAQQASNSEVKKSTTNQQNLIGGGAPKTIVQGPSSKLGQLTPQNHGVPQIQQNTAQGRGQFSSLITTQNNQKSVTSTNLNSIAKVSQIGSGLQRVNQQIVKQQQQQQQHQQLQNSYLNDTVDASPQFSKTQQSASNFLKSISKAPANSTQGQQPQFQKSVQYQRTSDITPTSGGFGFQQRSVNQNDQDKSPFDQAKDSDEVLEKAIQISQNFQQSPINQKLPIHPMRQSMQVSSGSQSLFALKGKSGIGGGSGFGQQNQQQKQQNGQQNLMANESFNLSPITQQAHEESPDMNFRQRTELIQSNMKPPQSSTRLNGTQSSSLARNGGNLVNPQTREKQSNSVYTTNNPYRQENNSSSLNRSNLFDNNKLEDKIKELQLNLANLPASFSRPKSKSYYSNQQQNQLPNYVQQSQQTNDQLRLQQIEIKPQDIQIQRNNFTSDQYSVRNDNKRNPFNKSTEAGDLRLSTDNDNMIGSTLSTSPDKKSFDQQDLGSTQFKIIVTQEEEAKDSQRDSIPAQYQNQQQMPQASLFHPSPALRKKISQTRLGQQFQQPELKIPDKLNEEIKEEDDNLLDNLSDHITTSQPGSFVNAATKMQQQAPQKTTSSLSVNQKQNEPSKPHQRQSLTSIYKKQNKLGPTTTTQTMHTIQPEKSKEPTFQQQLQQKLEEKKQQQMQQTQQIKKESVNQSAAVSNRLSLNPCQLTKTQRQEIQQQQQIQQAGGKLLKIKKKIVRDKIEEGDERQECDLCGRRFNEESFQKHIIICEKVFIKRRKEFNAQKQRTMDEEHQKFLETAQTKLSYYQIDQKLNAKWKIYSAQFRAAIQSAKTGKTVEGVPDDRVECEHCGRKFAAIPAQRHIPLCAKKAIDLQNKLKNKQAGQKQAQQVRKSTMIQSKLAQKK